MTIRGIEKYGKFNKSKKAMTSKIKSVLTGHKTPEEEQAEKDAAKREKISSQESGQRSGDHDRSEGAGESQGRRSELGDTERALPGEGKSVKEMSEEEKTDRGLALLIRAFERGLMKDVEREEASEKNHSATPGRVEGASKGTTA